MGTKTKDWFIVSVNGMDITDDKVSLHITNYKMVSPKILSQKYETKISPLRWITARDYKAGGGVATGVLIMHDGTEFNITYNWMGINTPENHRDRKTYTVQVKGRGIGDYWGKLTKQIIEEEGRPPTGVVFDFVKEIEPWRCLESPIRLFWRGIKYDFYVLMVGYRYRFRHFWNKTLPNETLVRSFRNRLSNYSILWRKRKNPQGEDDECK